MKTPANPSIIGHQPIIQYLEYGLKHGKISQSVLFIGPQHTGKTKIAFWLAKRQICEQQTACGTCKPCSSFEKGTHPDVHQIPDTDDKISVEQVRGLRSHMQRSPLSGNKVWGIIPAAERMNDQAANALLKELEEPKPQARFILTSNQPEQLLATIKSRCGIIRTQLVPTEEIYDAFVQVGVDRSKARNVARFSQGRPGIAIKYLKDGEYQRTILTNGKTFLSILSNPTSAAKLEFAETLLEDNDSKTALELIETTLRECMMHTSGEETALHGLFPASHIKAATKNTTPTTWAKRLNTLQQAQTEFATPSKHQTIFERLLLHL